MPGGRLNWPQELIPSRLPAEENGTAAARHRQVRDLIAMIGVARENRRRPVKLFGGHDSRQLVRPSRRPKGERERSGSQKSGFQTVRATMTNAALAMQWSHEKPSAVAKLQLVICLPFTSWEVKASNHLRLFPFAIAGPGGAALACPAQFDAGTSRSRGPAAARPTERVTKSRSGPAFGRARRVVLVMGCLSLGDARPAGRCSIFFRDCRTASPRAGRCG